MASWLSACAHWCRTAATGLATFMLNNTDADPQHGMAQVCCSPTRLPGSSATTSSRADASYWRTWRLCLSGVSSQGWYDKLMLQRCRTGAAFHPCPCAAGACRLSWYSPAAPSFGSSSAVLCIGAGDACLEPCASGYEKLQDAGICIQKCPDASAGPAQPCPASRTCVRGAGSLCPVLSDVPYLCTAPESFLGT